MAASPGEPARFQFLEHEGPVAFAHRGGSLENLENTWTAFEHAYGLGYRYMESDVHSTADGVAVLCHDPDLQRVAGRPERIEDLAWADLRRIPIDGSDPVPRLDEALAAWPQVRWNLDAKAERSVDVLVETLLRCAAVKRVCVTAFSDKRLARVRDALGPTLCTAMGPNAVAGLRMASLLPSSVPIAERFSAFGAVQVPLRWGPARVVDQRFVEAAHRAKLAVHAWTIDSEPVMRRLLELGVDGIMTDRPTLLRTVLRDRGQWTEPHPS